MSQKCTPRHLSKKYETTKLKKIYMYFYTNSSVIHKTSHRNFLNAISGWMAKETGIDTQWNTISFIYCK